MSEVEWRGASGCDQFRWDVKGETLGDWEIISPIAHLDAPRGSTKLTEVERGGY
jgi:hypothetical protein